MAFWKKLFGPPNIEELKARGDIKRLASSLYYCKKVTERSEEDDAIHEAAVRAMGALRDRRAVEPLVAVLTNNAIPSLPGWRWAPSTRRAAAHALGQIGDPQAVDPLIDTLDDHFLGTIAAEALVMIGSPHAVGALIAVLEDGGHRDRSLRVREQAAMTLGRIGDSQAVEALIRLLQDRRGSLASQAATALGMLGDQRAVEPLVRALLVVPQDSHRAPYTRREVVRALDSLGWKPDRSVSAARYWMQKGEYDKCVEIGAPAVPSLIAELKGRDWSCGGVEALGKIGDGRAVAPLIDALTTRLSETNATRCQYIAGALERLGDPRAIGPLVDVLKFVRDAAPFDVESAIGLGHGPTSYEPLSRQTAIALRSLTGHDFGLDAGAWERWWEEQGQQV